MQLEAKHILNLNESDSRSLILEIFDYQNKHNPVYRKFNELLSIKPESVRNVSDIPFLPVELFKSHRVSSTEDEEKVFESSATTGTERSKHHIPDLQFYEEVSKGIFEDHYGPLSEIVILALLPSYFDSPSSSLLHMVEHFIRQNSEGKGGFYMDNNESLIDELVQYNKTGQKHLLLGVSYALLDLAEKYSCSIPKTLIMETGGMKGRRAELTRQELHERLKSAFDIKNIHSEYGMTEMQSQLYSKGEGIFQRSSSTWIFIKDPYDPLRTADTGITGKIAIIDLANYKTCSFIQTSDLGRLDAEGNLEILGRLDHSDIRGCNLLLS